MRNGCLQALASWALLYAAYHYLLASRWAPPATWLVPAIVSLITLGGFGALWNAWRAARDARLLDQAGLATPLIDGQMAVAAGIVEPVGEPLTSPFSGLPCVLYEYELRSSHDAPDVALGGFRAEPYAVVNSNRVVRVWGMPDLKDWPVMAILDKESLARTRAFLEQQEFRDLSGVRIDRLLRAIVEVMSDDDGTVDEHWERTTGARNWFSTEEIAAWLAQPDPPEGEARAHEARPENDDEEDEDFDDDFDEDDDLDEDELEEAGASAPRAPQLPWLREKRVAPGERVCVFGVYSAEKNALVPETARSGQILRIEHGQADQVAKRARQTARGGTIGGLVALTVVHAGLWLGDWAYRANPQVKVNRSRELKTALEKGDTAQIEELWRLDETPASARPAYLTMTENPEVVATLLRLGANPNQKDSEGRTPLMLAAWHRNVAVLRQLIAAGAQLDEREPQYDQTALEYALNSENEESIAALREAGAHDETVDERNGKPVTEFQAPPVRCCVAYLEAIHAADADTLRAMSATGRKADFSEVDWDIWRNSRPHEKVDYGGHANDEAATILLQGPTPGGYRATWEFQLVNESGDWKVLRERWLTKGPRAGR